MFGVRRLVLSSPGMRGPILGVTRPVRLPGFAAPAGTWRTGASVGGMPDEPSGEPAPLDTAKLIKTLTDKERALALGAGVLSMAAFLAVYLPVLHHRAPKGMAPYSTWLAVGLALGLALVVASLSRRRALVAFASFFVGFAFLESPLRIAGLCYLGLSGFLLMRVSKYQRAEAARRGAEAAARRRERRAGQADTRSQERRPPAPSKRYTPPRGAKRRRGPAPAP
jgi:hypothetical protein